MTAGNYIAGSILGCSGFSAEISLSLAAELPPPYTAIASPDASGVPVINCRVCQSLINLDGKLHQHVVKCTVCNEATVKWVFSIFLFVGGFGGRIHVLTWTGWVPPCQPWGKGGARPVACQCGWRASWRRGGMRMIISS